MAKRAVAARSNIIVTLERCEPAMPFASFSELHKAMSPRT